jgi:hypothetical protein
MAIQDDDFLGGVPQHPSRAKNMLKAFCPDESKKSIPLGKSKPSSLRYFVPAIIAVVIALGGFLSQIHINWPWPR